MKILYLMVLDRINCFPFFSVDINIFYNCTKFQNILINSGVFISVTVEFWKNWCGFDAITKTLTTDSSID